MYGINILTDGQMKSELWLNNFIFQLLQLKSLLTGAFKFIKETPTLLGDYL